MKRLSILLLFVTLFLPQINQSQTEITTGIIDKYLKFVTLEKKSVSYEATVEYDTGTKSFVKLGLVVDSYNVDIPELSIALKSPEIKGLRIENGTVWLSNSPTPYSNVVSLNIHREIWYDGQGNIISDVVYSDSPTIPNLIDVNVDDDTNEFINAMVKFIKSKN
ncbi:hypothetical protein [Algibacter sp. PT7-4]|uniref:hypothetical protein n=1 Tax=Algibacter ulvanivorans TaxID=3400999 RepID=UPI003AACDD59